MSRATRRVWRWIALGFGLTLAGIAGLVAPALAQATGGGSVIPTGTDTTAPLLVLGAGLTTMTGVVAVFGRALATGKLVPQQTADRENELVAALKQVTDLLAEAQEARAEAQRREDRLWEWAVHQSGFQPPDPRAER